MPCSSPTNGQITKLAVEQMSSNEPNLNPMARDGRVDLEWCVAEVFGSPDQQVSLVLQGERMGRGSVGYQMLASGAEGGGLVKPRPCDKRRGLVFTNVQSPRDKLHISNSGCHLHASKPILHAPRRASPFQMTIGTSCIYFIHEHLVGNWRKINSPERVKEYIE